MRSKRSDIISYSRSSSSFFKIARRDVTLAYTNLYNWYCGNEKRHQIIPHLIVGQIPTEEDAKEILEEYPNLKCVFSINELIELEYPSIFGKIQTRKKWEEMNVEHELLIMEDFTANADVKSIYAIIQKMHGYISRGEDIYLHCKAGVGRSAMICACYLAVYGSGDGQLKPGSSVKEVRDLIFSKRNQIHLRKENYDKIREVIKYHESKLNEKIELLDRKSTQTASTVLDKLHHFCSSLEGLRLIKQLPAAKALRSYGEEKTQLNTGQHIKDFFKSIDGAKNGDWYINFLNGKDSLQNLLDERPGWFGGQPKRRKILVDDLKKALKDLFIKQLKCSALELNSLERDVVVDNISLATSKSFFIHEL